MEERENIETRQCDKTNLRFFKNQIPFTLCVVFVP